MRGRLALALILLVAVMAPISSGSPNAEAANCEFVLGFKALRDMIPAVVGDCLVGEHHNPANGDGLQETTAWHGKGGLMVWRKADNWTAFTDGSITWINGPNGVQSRPNQGPLFSWESPSGNAPPVASQAPQSCPILPGPTIARVLRNNQNLASRLGCAQNNEVSVQLAWQSFQGGHLLWRTETSIIYALRQGSTWLALNDTYAENESLYTVLAPPNYHTPVRGFGKVWRYEPGLRDALGWATIPEHGMTGNWQDFSNGRLIYVLFDRYNGTPVRTVYALFSDNSWLRIEDEAAQ